MATETELMSFENVLHIAFAGVMGNGGLPLIYPENSTEALPDDYVFVVSDGFAETGHYQQNGASVWVADQWTCQVLVTTVTKRLERTNFFGAWIPNNHSQMRAKIREVLQRGTTSTANLNTWLTNHKIEFLKQTGTAHSFDADSGNDISQITYHMQFSVKSTSWPS